MVFMIFMAYYHFIIIYLSQALFLLSNFFIKIFLLASLSSFLIFYEKVSCYTIIWLHLNEG